MHWLTKCTRVDFEWGHWVQLQTNWRIASRGRAEGRRGRGVGTDGKEMEGGRKGARERERERERERMEGKVNGWAREEVLFSA